MERRYERAIKQVVAQMRQEFGDDLLGMLLGGSVAYGCSGPRSDLDIYVVIRPARRQRRTRIIEGVEVDLFINPVHVIRRQFTDTPSTFTMFARGRILDDPHGLMEQLVAEATEALKQPPPAVPSEEMPRLRYGLTDSLKDAFDLAEIGDEAAANYLVFFTLQRTIEAHYRLNRRWPVKAKYLLDDLAEHAPGIEPLTRRLLHSEGTVHERCAVLEELVECVLAPVGGTITEWETTRQEVPEPKGEADSPDTPSVER